MPFFFFPDGFSAAVQQGRRSSVQGSAGAQIDLFCTGRKKNKGLESHIWGDIIGGRCLSYSCVVLRGGWGGVGGVVQLDAAAVTST